MPSLGSAINKFKKSGNKSWSTLKTSLRAVETSANVFPPLQLALDGLLACLDSVQTAATNRQDYEEMANDLNTVAGILKQYVGELGSEDYDGNVAYLAHRIEDQVARIEKQQGSGMVKRVIESTQDKEDVIKYYRQIEVLFRHLQSDISIRTWIDGDKQLVATLLRSMDPSDDARYNSSYSATIRRHGCTPETREAVRAEIQHWVHDPNAAKVYWMSGMAGTGKTTIAYSLCEWLKDKKLLGASFFCSRISASSRRVSRIVPTIAYQLARYSPAFRSALCKKLKEDPDVSTLDVVQQFRNLIQEPMMVAKAAIPASVVVVIDALDECEDIYGVLLVLDTLLRFAENLALKFFVTSRPEPAISDKFASTNGISSVLYLHDIEQSIVENDIKKFLTATLSVMLPPASDAQIEQLTKQSGKLFIYAAIVARYIIPEDLYVDSDARLQVVLALDSRLSHGGPPSKTYDELNQLYTAILTTIFDDRLEPAEIEHRRLVLWTIVCAREPLTYSTLSSLLRISERQVSTAIHTMRSVLYVSGTNGPVSTLHASFSEYMLDQLRSHQFACNDAQHSQLLANRCFGVMKDQLRFNICDLGSSFVFDQDVPDLPKRVENYIPPVLRYACRYWGEHLQFSDFADDLHCQLVDFLSHRLLFWIEVLNLRQHIGLGASILSQAQSWLLHFDTPATNTHTRIADARNFVGYFAANACSRSTSHLYISALPFFSRATMVHRQYWGCTRGLIDAKGTAFEHRRPRAIAAWRTDSVIKTAALSRDGVTLVLGSSSGVISTRDAHVGTVTSGPFEGHTGAVNSVSVSPDGRLVVSASSDHTIRIWDLGTGNASTRSLVGHADSVDSVAFSSDGAHIASGSSDCTIQVWETQTGAPRFSPLREHTGPVNSVGFSPDGAFIVSGSNDHTIRLWDIRTSDTTARVLQGHTDSVLSVSSSPDGTRVVSGSEDQTIRVWDAHTCALAAGPFVGHEGAINSVAFSHDGMRIGSGSDDCTIRVWGTLTGELVTHPFKINNGMVHSVTFSLDDTRLISCSDDKTIRLWDVQSRSVDSASSDVDADKFSIESLAISPDSTRIVSGTWLGTLHLWDAFTGAKVFGPFEGHTESVNSLAFSPDGLVIASGSGDYTVRLWDAQTGAAISEPLLGHTAAIQTVTFSPDGAWIASGGYDYTIRIWPTDNSHTSVILHGHERSISSVAFSPDSTRIASASYDKIFRIWDVRTGEAIVAPLEEPNKRISSIVYSHDGTLIATSYWDCTIILWDAHTGAIIGEPLHDSLTPVRSIAFSCDDKFIVSGSGGLGSAWPDDFAVRLWDVKAREVVEKFEGHPGPVHSVEFSPDGTCVVSGSRTQVRVLSLQKPESLHDIFTSAWKLEGDGWVTVNGAPLFWIWRDMHQFLPHPRDALVISPHGSLRIDYWNLLLGERWIDCYTETEV